MATQAQDTGGLGLLQQLVQSGFPPQLLLQLLMAQPQGSTLMDTLRPEPVGATSEAPAPDANNNPEGLSGSGTATLGAILGGAMRGGALGQGLQSLGVPGALQGPGAKVALTGLHMATGAPSMPMSLFSSLLGMAMVAAKGSQRAAGVRTAPITFGGPRNVIDNPPPNSTFNDPNNVDMGLSLGEPSLGLGLGQPSLGLGLGIPSVPSFTPTLNLDLTAPVAPPPTFDPPTLADLTPADQAIIDAIDAAANALGEPSGGPGGPAADGPAGGPGGNSGSPTGGGDSGNPGDF